MSYFSIDNLQRLKLAVHIAQAVFIFVSWCLMIAVFRGAFIITASPGWYFGLCFLSIPAIIYQTMTPMFEKSRKWGNPYAFAAIDISYTILWLSAFASVAAYNSTGFCGGACSVSKATVGLGFFIFLFFGLTSAMSVYGLVYFRRNGALPGGSRVPTNATMIDPDREAFSTAPHDDEYAPVHLNDKDDGQHEMEGETSGSAQYDPVSYDTTSAHGYIPPSVSDTSYRTYGAEPPSQMGYGDAEAERVRFPVGNYN